jgi:hypothetical protein
MSSNVTVHPVSMPQIWAVSKFVVFAMIIHQIYEGPCLNCVISEP